MNIVSKTNTYENNFLSNKEATNFETPNPINVYYQIAQNSDYCFKTGDILKAAQRNDLDSLRDDYKSRNSNDSRARRFEKSDYNHDPLSITTKISKTQRQHVAEKLRSQSAMSQYNESVKQNLDSKIEPEMPLTGYNYQKYLNEGSILFKAAMSAQKIKELSLTMDEKMKNQRLQIRSLKKQVLLEKLNNIKD